MKKEKGITIVALVVTIAILLILAGVTVGTLFGENGIVTKAQEAADLMNERAEEEQETLRELEEWLGAPHTGSNNVTEGEGEKIITLKTKIGMMRRQKASYLQISTEIVDQATGAKMTIYPGIDYVEPLIENDTDGVFSNKNCRVSLVKDVSEANGTGLQYSAGCFTKTVIEVALKTGRTYVITSYARGGNDIDHEGYKSMVNIGSKTITVSDRAEVAVNNWDWRKIIDADGDKSIGGADLIPYKNAIKGTSTGMTVTNVGSSYFYVEAIDPNTGDIKSGMEDFIGFDVNRDGVIDSTDLSIAEMIIGNALDI